jgi:transcriptional regulator of aromatic amino acid metabolism
MVRKDLFACVLAHAVSNALLAVWVVALGVITMSFPPLRECGVDILLLAEALLQWWRHCQHCQHSEATRYGSSYHCWY